jgi:hypothetical protein
MKASMPDRDPVLTHRLAEHLDAARQLVDRFEERPWRGNDKLLVCCGVNNVQVRYLVNEPVRRSWEQQFKPTLAAEELFAWLESLR